MSSSHTITTNLPFGLFSSATLTSPLPAPSKMSRAIFNIDDAGPTSLPEDVEDGDVSPKLFWED